VEDRRRSDDKNWEEIREFIETFNRFMGESREYRAADFIRQEYIKKQVDKTNGRVNDLEDWKNKVEVKIQDKKDNWANLRDFLTVTATVIMAVSALVVFIKK